jgi:hypothetical protein
VTRAQPVPAAPPTVSDVVRHGASVGFGALGLARRAVGVALTRVQPTTRRASPPVTPPGTLDLIPGAVAGVAIVAERHVRAAAVAVASGASGTVRAATRPAAVQRLLRPFEDWVWTMNEVARREQARNRAEAAALLPMLIQQVTENVIAQLDLARIAKQIPVEDIVDQIDIEAIVQRLELGSIIRQSTAGLTGDVVEALRDQGMALDSLSARIVDRMLFRRRPRQLEVRAR